MLCARQSPEGEWTEEDDDGVWLEVPREVLERIDFSNTNPSASGIGHQFAGTQLRG